MSLFLAMRDLIAWEESVWLVASAAYGADRCFGTVLWSAGSEIQFPLQLQG